MKRFRSSILIVLPLLLGACAVTPRADLVGSAVPEGAATRTVTITPDTRYVNVVGGEVVRFVGAGRAFAWDFHVSPTVSVFALDRVAPPGTLDHQVLVYVRPDPRYHES